jgi:hypothetical protein
MLSNTIFEGLIASLCSRLEFVEVTYGEDWENFCDESSFGKRKCRDLFSSDETEFRFEVAEYIVVRKEVLAI